MLMRLSYTNTYSLYTSSMALLQLHSSSSSSSLFLCGWRRSCIGAFTCKPSIIITARFASSSATAAAQSSQRPGTLDERFQKLPELLEDVVRTTIKTGPRGAVRLAQGIQAMVSVSGEWVLQQTRLPWSINTESDMGLPGPVQLRQLFERLGATYIKLGQFIASSPTLFPKEYVEEFQKCLDKTPPVPYSVIKDIIQTELGRPLEEVYEFVDPQPIASASIAQVHGARLRGSLKDVVIKVLKPGVEDMLVADLNFLYVAARILEFLNPVLSRTSLVGIVGDLRASMLDEVDFRKEAANIEAFRNYLESAGLNGLATAPEIYRHCSTQQILTLERLYGVSLTDLDSVRSLVVNPETTLIHALNVWFGSLVACEIFHADVHSGNLLVLQDGRIGFIDFGIVGRISPTTLAAVEAFWKSIESGEATAMSRALVQMGATDTEVDIKKFAKDLEKIFSQVKDLDTEIVVTAAGGPKSTTIAATLAVNEQQINVLLINLIGISEAYGLKFPREFGLLLKQLLYFDRYTRLLAPNLRVLGDDRIVFGSNQRDGPRF